MLLLVHTYNYNICADFVVCYSMDTSRLPVLVYCFQALKGDLELEIQSPQRIAHRQEIKFQLPIPKKFALPGKCFSLGEVGT